ncbi:hypothetical protein BU16DRAFT_586642 [Lophium mytilinum]|uniref:PARP-type domain-containing protein n=1 Tax=Lophium mytilinum TaxID=390894 RepID=A0A6A6QA05_9PEZI|nr:hypothetical protein BU16DRAFT_586642 [Lophium mytilinum]
MSLSTLPHVTDLLPYVLGSPFDPDHGGSPNAHPTITYTFDPPPSQPTLSVLPAIAPGFEDDADNIPKHRVEHSPSNQAACQSAPCKRGGHKIELGELRFGTYTLFYHTGDMFWTFKHWRCVTSKQIATIKDIAKGEPENAPGYDTLTEQAKEHVRLAFEAGSVTDKTFKGILEPAYKVEVAPQARATCQNKECKDAKIKIKKGELRLGIQVRFQGHEGWRYKHWKVRDVLAVGELEGFDGLGPEDQDFITGSCALVDTGVYGTAPDTASRISPELKRKLEDTSQSAEASGSAVVPKKVKVESIKKNLKATETKHKRLSTQEAVQEKHIHVEGSGSVSHDLSGLTLVNHAATITEKQRQVEPFGDVTTDLSESQPERGTIDVQPAGETANVGMKMQPASKPKPETKPKKKTKAKAKKTTTTTAKAAAMPQKEPVIIPTRTSRSGRVVKGSYKE